MTAANTGEPFGNELVDLVGPFWSEAKVCDALRTDEADLALRRAEGSVLAVTTTDGDRFYPLDQFVRRDGGAEVRSVLLPVFRALRTNDPWTVAVLLHTPAPELDGLTPLDWIRDGGSEQALARLAQVVAHEWAQGSGSPA